MSRKSRHLARVELPCNKFDSSGVCSPETGTFDRPFPRRCKYLTAPLWRGAFHAQMHTAKINLTCTCRSGVHGSEQQRVKECSSHVADRNSKVLQRNQGFWVHHP